MQGYTEQQLYDVAEATNNPPGLRIMAYTALIKKQMLLRDIRELCKKIEEIVIDNM
jgi:hypothetical protein